MTTATSATRASPAEPARGVCSSGASCAAYTPEGPFWMSGKTCELDDFQDYACDTPNTWSPQLSPEWTGSSTGVLFSWELEESGVWDDTIADPATYVPTCDTESPDAPIDLRSIDGAYEVTDNGVEAWTLALEQPPAGARGRRALSRRHALRVRVALREPEAPALFRRPPTWPGSPLTRRLEDPPAPS